MSVGRHCYLTRIQSLETGTYGVLHFIGQAPFALTLELPWRDNERQVSAIPAGHYRVQRVQSPKFGDTFEVTGVEGRSHILFHKGNTTADTNGCILVGSSFVDLDGDGDQDLGGSAAAWAIFKAITRGWSAFPLTIREMTDRDIT